MSGIWSTGNSTSTTGPITRDTRPTPPAGAVSGLVSATAVLMWSLSVLFGGGGGLGQRAGPTDDLGNLLGDLGLPGLVGLPGQPLDQLLCVVGGRLHRLLSAGQLRGRRLQQAELNPAGHVERQQLVEHSLGVGLE